MFIFLFLTLGSWESFELLGKSYYFYTAYRFAIVSNNLFMMLDDPPIMELGSLEQRSPGPPLEFCRGFVGVVA